MADDSVKLNIEPAAVVPASDRVELVTGAKAASAVDEKSGRKYGGRPMPDDRHKDDVGVDQLFAQLEIEIAAANRDLERHGINVRLSLLREETVIHLEIEDRRPAGQPVMRRIRVIGPEDIQQLHRDLVEEAGICVDEVA